MAQFNINERFSFPDQTWFDANNPGQLHDALRADYARTVAAANRRPSLRRHMVACAVCQSIGSTLTTVAPEMESSDCNQVKLRITPEQMHTLLGLPASLQVVHMYADNEPNTVTVKVHGQGLPQVLSGHSTPVTPTDVTERSTPKTS